MKSILISIQPQWVEKILNGEKTIEIRKTAPKEHGCKVYIYCTQSKQLYQGKDCVRADYLTTPNPINKRYVLGANYGECLNGKVVAEFRLAPIEHIEQHQVYNAKVLKKYACLSIQELGEYTKGKGFYAWHIEDLVVYDKPKELSEFTHNVPDYSNGVVIYSLKKEPLKRPPQSWCYVEELED